MCFMYIISFNSPNIPNEAGAMVICTLQIRKLKRGWVTRSWWIWNSLPGCPAGSWWPGSWKVCVPLSSQCIRMVPKSALSPCVRPGDTALLREGPAGTLSLPCSKVPRVWGAQMSLCQPDGEAWWWRCPLHTCDCAIPKGSQVSLGPASCCHMLLIHVDISCSASSPLS